MVVGGCGLRWLFGGGRWLMADGAGGWFGVGNGWLVASSW